MDLPTFQTQSDPFGVAQMVRTSSDTVTPVAVQAKEAAANPFFSGVSSLLGNVFTGAGGFISKATETAGEAVGMALAGKLVGSSQTTPLGQSPEAYAAQVRAQQAAAGQPGTFTAQLPPWLLPTAAIAAAGLIVVLMLRQKD